MSRVLDELSMLTGVISEDREYLLALLLKKNVSAKKKTEEITPDISFLNASVKRAKTLEELVREVKIYES